MTKIQKGKSILTAINVFTVLPQDQGRLLELLQAVIQKHICKFPGFISANLHLSLDGNRVVNYVQWRSRADFQAVLDDAATKTALKDVFAVVKSADSSLYEVAEIYQGQDT